MSVRHIAVVNFTRMGDLIQSGPLLRSLVNSHPGSRLTLIVFDKFKDVAQRLPMVNTVIGFDVDELARRLDSRHSDLKRAYNCIAAFLSDPSLQNIDVVHNLSHTPLSATLSSLLRAEQVQGLQRTASGHLTMLGDWFTYLLSIMQERALNPFNLVEIYLHMNPLRGGKLSLEFSVTDADTAASQELLRKAGIGQAEKYVALQPGASTGVRQWPASAFAGLSQRLASLGLRSLLVGSRDELPLAQEVLSHAQGSLVSVVGMTDAGGLAAVLKGAQKLVSNDTGTIHLAAAVGTPTVGLYVGPASAKDTAPYGNGHIILEPDLACAPCGYHHRCHDYKCHRSFTVDDVFFLVTAPESEVARIAAQIRGVRVMRSAVGDSGEFSLKRLNQPVHAVSEELIQFYRSFWDGLLNQAQPHSQACTPDWSEGLSALRGILDMARESLSDIQRQAARANPNPATLTDLLRNQRIWHDALGRFMDCYPLLAPLPRFLMVRISTLRADELSDYLRDIRMSFDLFERGFRLLEFESSRTAILEPAHAATA